MFMIFHLDRRVALLLASAALLGAGGLLALAL